MSPRRVNVYREPPSWPVRELLLAILAATVAAVSAYLFARVMFG